MCETIGSALSLLFYPGGRLSEIERVMLGNIIIHTTRVWEAYKRVDNALVFDTFEESALIDDMQQDENILEVFTSNPFKVV
jgi:hypothetical protein